MRDKHFVLFGCAALMVALATVPAEAQRRYRAHGGHRAYHLGLAQWYPYPHPVFGFPPGMYPHDAAVSLRLQVTPREASVFVDGYAAGSVDDYDGVFQRLRLVPGPHEIVIYHPGYRTLRQHIYYSPGSTHTIRRTLEPLLPGEPLEPQPVPRVLPAPGAPGVPAYPQAPEGGRGPDSARSGTLALRVQPADATVLVDGEPWKGPQTQDRLVIQLPEGPHRVRVERSGYQPFVVDVDVRAGETASFNVSLLSR